MTQLLRHGGFTIWIVLLFGIMALTTLVLLFSYHTSTSSKRDGASSVAAPIGGSVGTPSTDAGTNSCHGSGERFFVDQGAALPVVEIALLFGKPRLLQQTDPRDHGTTSLPERGQW